MVYGDPVDCATKLGRILGSFTTNSGFSEIKDSYFGKIHLIYGNLRLSPPNKALETMALGGTRIFQWLIEKTNPTSSLQLRFEALYTKKSNISYQTSKQIQGGLFETSTWYQGKATDLLPGKLKFPSPANRKS